MNDLARIRDNFTESIETQHAALEAVAESIEHAVHLMVTALLNGNKVMACGNGGSGADAQHFASEMLNRFDMERPGLPAIALTADTAVLTSVANDHAYEEVFARQLRVLGNPGDVLLAMSTTGSSPSMINAVMAAHSRDVHVIALSGGNGGEIATLLHQTDVEVRIPCSSTPRIQEVHLLIVHCICDLIDQHLFGK